MSNCPCNGACHNGHTVTCSEDCRGKQVIHDDGKMREALEAFLATPWEVWSAEQDHVFDLANEALK